MYIRKKSKKGVSLGMCIHDKRGDMSTSFISCFIQRVPVCHGLDLKPCSKNRRNTRGSEPVATINSELSLKGFSDHDNQ